MKRAICAGSFDPVSLGHENMIRRAAALCDTLIVVLASNKSKKYMFTEDQRLEMLRAACADIENVEIVCFDGIIARYAKEHNCECMIRGLRNAGDFEYETDLSHIYASYGDYPLETVYIISDARYAFLSSSIIRENIQLGADLSGFVSSGVNSLISLYRKDEL